MDREFTILMLVVILALLLMLWRYRRRDAQTQKTIHYLSHPSLLNQNEHHCFKAIKQAAGGRYDVHCKVCLSSIVTADKHTSKSLWSSASQSLREHTVDFLLTDVENSQFVCVIELDDSSPYHSRKPRDIFSRQVLSNANVPYIRLETMPVYDAEEIARSIEALLKPVQQAPLIDETAEALRIVIEPDLTSRRGKL